jgi:hypothetical protein
MASILNVDQINNAAGTSAVTIDASTGKASFPNGATLPAGSVLQVVSTSTIGNTSTTSSSDVTTGVDLSITPTSSSNKIMVIFSGVAQNTSSTGGTKISVYRDGSKVYDPTIQQFSSSGGNTVCSFCVQYLDTPATTSSVTYTQYFAQYNAGTAYASNLQITLMEIAQ